MLPIQLPGRATASTDGRPPSCSPRCIAEGDLVIVYEGLNSMKAVYVEAKGWYDNRFGHFPHKEWIGLPFGSKVYSKSGPGGHRGWVHLLAPTTDLWSLVLRHRTQILYIADISMVCMYLDLRPGCTVLESGTGSGSLTHSLVRAVAPTGHVHTFEFHPERAAEAAKEFEKHKLSGWVTVRQRNIEERGFPCGAEGEEEGMIDLTGRADAVFLDLPAPYKVVPSAAKCLRPDGRLCSFSPCIEQVQRTCEALECNGFTDLQTFEILLRVLEVRTETLSTSFEAPAQGGGGRKGRGQQQGQGHQGRQRGNKRGRGSEGEQHRQHQQRKGEAAAEAAAEGQGAETAGEVAAQGEGEGQGDDTHQQQQQQQNATEQQQQEAGTIGKDQAAAGGQQQHQDQNQGGGAGEAEQQGDVDMPDARVAAVAEVPGAEFGQTGGSGSAGAVVSIPRAVTLVTSRPAHDARGHTGYLTFARKFVTG